MLSPGGNATLAQGKNISRVADMFRITGDWHDCGPKDDDWGKLCPSNLTYFPHNSCIFNRIWKNMWDSPLISSIFLLKFRGT